MTNTDEKAQKKAKKVPPTNLKELAKTVEERLATLEEKEKEIEERKLKSRQELEALTRIETPLSNRNLDAKKKILLGSFLQHWAGDKNRRPIASYEDLKKMLDEHLTRDSDREFFGLEPKPRQVPNSASQGIKIPQETEISFSNLS